MYNISNEFADNFISEIKLPRYQKQLMSWDIIEFYKSSKHVKKSKVISDWMDLHYLKYTNNWEKEFENNHYLTQNDNAIVITNLENKIIWVSNNFTSMTGYSKRFAVNKYPNFLQGIDSKTKELKQLSSDLKKFHKATNTIINYRKNGEKYFCNITIEPLLNSKNQHTHYIAFEKEVTSF